MQANFKSCKFVTLEDVAALLFTCIVMLRYYRLYSHYILHILSKCKSQLSHFSLHLTSFQLNAMRVFTDSKSLLTERDHQICMLIKQMYTAQSRNEILITLYSPK